MSSGEWFYLESGRELGPVTELVPGSLARASATSTFAFLAYPSNPGQSGVRSFCGDSSGRLCYDPRGGKDLIERVGAEVQCSMRCETLP